MQTKRVRRVLRRLGKTALGIARGPVEAPRRLLGYAVTKRHIGGPLDAVDFRERLSRDEFVERYLSKNRPVVVTDAMDDWPARKWTLDAFERDFGDHTVILQSPEFEGSDVSTLRDFLRTVRTYEHLPLESLPPPSQVPYVRSVVAAEGEDFVQAAFERLTWDWKRPYFLPVGGYVFPFGPLCSLPNVNRHPLFGFYVSPRGAATALHVDGYLSNAVLGQITGEKKVFLFTPDQARRLPRHKERPPVHYLRGETPDFRGVKPLELTLGPGMMIFIPKYHWHEVFTLTASISIGYNFVHASDATPAWLRDARRYVRGERSFA